MSECNLTASSTFADLEAPLRLLMVEDSSVDAALIALTLKKAGVRFTYDIAVTIADCQHYLQQSVYDVVLSDYRLPGFTAYQTLQLLQSSQQDIPLILVTGTLGEEAAVECIKAGMTDYVLKDRLWRLPMVLARSLDEFVLRRQQQAAIAQMQQQAQRDMLLSRIVQTMRGTLVLEEVLQTTADLLHETLQVSRCSIFRPDGDRNISIEYVSHTTPEREHLLGIQCDFFNYYQPQLQAGNPLVLNSIDQALPLEVRRVAEQFNIRAIAITPLIYQDQQLGGICLHQCDRARGWTSEEIDLVQAIADQCAIAIHQAQLFEQVQQQAQREQLLNQILQALNSKLEPEHILQEIVRLTGECFQVDRVAIFALEADYIHVLKEWRAHEQISSVLDSKEPILTWIDLVGSLEQLTQQRVFHAPNLLSLEHPPARKAHLEKHRTRSLLSVNISIRDQFFGGLSLSTVTHRRTFTDDEIHLLERIADQTAIALYNAQSYERLELLVQQRTQELEREKLLSESANRSKSEFLTHMSHELRTPLTGILGFSSLLLKQVFGPLNSKQQQYIEGIASCGEHLLDLINDLLDLSKIEAGKEELVLETVVVEEVCDAGTAMVREMASNRGLQLGLRIQPNVTCCTADKRRLKQILFNLLSNAVKFTEAGSVRLEVSQTADKIFFSVIDTGIGISEADQAKLFQSFQQLDGGLDRKYEGTGLGLSLARKLAQLHGGNITVTSEVGQGSCFTVELPLDKAEG